MAISASIIEYACQIAATGSAAALALALGTAPDAANRTGVYSELSAGVERVSVVVGGIDGASIRRSGSDATLRLQAGTRDGIALAPRGGGTGTWLATITTAALTASRTYTLPDATGTVGLLEVAQTWQAAQTVRVNGNSEIKIDSQNASNVAYLTLLNSGASGRQYSLNVGGNTSSFPNQFFIYDNTALAARLTLISSGEFGLSAAPTAGNGLLQLASGTTVANSLAFGSDCGLWRSAAGTLVHNAQGTANDATFTLVRTGGVNFGFSASSSVAVLGTATNHGIEVRANAIPHTSFGTTGIINLLGAARAIQMNGTQVLTNRRTGWTAATGTATKTTFDTATVTLPQLAERMKALIDDLMPTAGHGLIGA